MDHVWKEWRVYYDAHDVDGVAGRICVTRAKFMGGNEQVREGCALRKEVIQGSPEPPNVPGPDATQAGPGDAPGSCSGSVLLAGADNDYVKLEAHSSAYESS